MEGLAEIVGSNLQTLRKANNLTQQELADKLHYSDKSISKWELGYATPSVDILKEFADYFGVTVDYLITPHEEEETKEMVKQKQKDSGPQAASKAIILALVNVVVLAIATAIYVSGFVQNKQNVLWVAFVWMIPIALILSVIVARMLYGRNPLLTMILFSCFVWFLVFAFYIQFRFVNQPTQDLWYILLVCLPIQAILILAYLYNRSKI